MEPFQPDDAHAVGTLAGKASATDVVDVQVVLLAHRHRFSIVTSDEDDLRLIADAMRAKVPLLAV